MKKFKGDEKLAGESRRPRRRKLLLNLPDSMRVLEVRV